MKTILTIYVILAVIFISLVVITYVKIIQAHDEVNSRIGKELVIKNDTLMIIDYSLLKGCYILEDGREIDDGLAKKLLIK